MYQRKRVLRVLSVICLVLCSLLLAPSRALADESDGQTNRFNVVLVTDASGSLLETDPDELRFRSMANFLYLLTMEGNNVGSVAFGEGVPLEVPMSAISTRESRDDLIDQNRDVELEGWTNIGEGLDAAVDMLDEQGDEDLPSIILILSDGNTDMPDEDSLKASNDAKSSAVERARQNGYVIYAVSLNANGEANSAELEQLASATGGEFREVSDASDLDDVYRLYQSIIFGSISTPGGAQGSFDIARIGVEEVNIAISGEPTELTFVEPSGSTLPESQLKDVTFSTEGLTVVKIEDPEPGTWNYKVADVDDDSVSVDIVRNVNVNTRIESNVDEDDVLETGDSVRVEVSLLEDGRAVSGDVYQYFTGELAVTDSSGDEDTVELEAGSRALFAELELSERGSYTVSAKVEGEGFELATSELVFNVENAAPVPTGQVIEQTAYLWPFIDNTATIDLTPGASDPDGGDLEYSVDSSSFMSEEYEIDGSNLVITSYSLSEGSFTVRATDPDGGWCTFDVRVATVNIGLLTLIGIGIATVVVLAILGILLWIALNKRFYGVCYVRPFDNTSGYAYFDEVSREKGRGRLRLFAFGCETFGINPKKAYFQASGKDYVTFVSKDPIFAGGMMTKKIKVPGNGFETVISTDQSMQRGVIVRFVSRKSNSGMSGGFGGDGFGGGMPGGGPYGGASGGYGDGGSPYGGASGGAYGGDPYGGGAYGGNGGAYGNNNGNGGAYY